MSRGLALLWQFGFDGVGDEFSQWGIARWRPCEEVEDGLPDGGMLGCGGGPRLFFSVRCFEAGD